MVRKAIKRGEQAMAEEAETNGEHIKTLNKNKNALKSISD